MRTYPFRRVVRLVLQIAAVAVALLVPFGCGAAGLGGDGPGNSGNSYCAVVDDWQESWAAFEAEVLVLLNERRAAGADCGTAGVFAAAGPLAMDEALRCAARNHCRDMAVRNFLGHENPDGDGPAERIDRAGYEGSGWAENIAWGYPSPSEVVAGWMISDGHCANVMGGSFVDVGVGYYHDADGHFWTLNFGGP